MDIGCLPTQTSQLAEGKGWGNGGVIKKEEDQGYAKRRGDKGGVKCSLSVVDVKNIEKRYIKTPRVVEFVGESGVKWGSLEQRCANNSKLHSETTGQGGKAPTTYDIYGDRKQEIFQRKGADACFSAPLRRSWTTRVG